MTGDRGPGGAGTTGFERSLERLVLPASGHALDATISARAAAPPPADLAAVDSLPRLSVDEGDRAAGPVAAGPGPDLTVTGLLGEGGMGRVELARQRSLDRDVALKRPRDDARPADAVALRHEARVTGALEHPNIVPVHALGRDDAGRPVIVLKRVEGVSWRELLLDDGHPGWARREPDPSQRLTFHLGVLAQVSNAVAFAHSRDLIHRDIKPGNVLIGDYGEVYLVDWALATPATAAPADDDRVVLVGTPAYMAPEMVAGGPYDARTDVFLLGATLHEILTRRVRHEGGDLRAVLARAFAAAPFAYGDDVAADLAELANRATARDPAARPPSAAGFRQHVLDHLRHRGSIALCATADERLAALEADLHRTPDEDAVDRGLDECRFAYRQALIEWPDNHRARHGLERCASARVQLEVARGNPHAARAALGELASPPAALVAAVVAAEADHAAALAERDRLRRLERDADPRIATRTRRRTLAFLSVIAAVIAALGIRSERAGENLDAGGLAGFAAMQLAVSLAAIFVMRRRLLANAYNRRLILWFILLMTFLLISRVVGALLGTPAPSQLAGEMVVQAAMLAVGSVWTFRGAALGAVPLLVGAVLAALRPERAFTLNGLAVGLTVVIVLVALPRATLLADRPTR